MHFNNPDILWGLFALLIPIIIHLFNFRRYRKIYFTNVKDLQEISIKTQKNARLKKIIVLLLRMMVITGLVMAFAGPFRGEESQQEINPGASYISVYIDNSFSMEATEGGIALLDLAKNRAHELSKSYSISDRFQLLTNNFNAKQQRFLNRDEFDEEVDKITFSPIVRSLDDIQMRQNALFSEIEGNKYSYIISDFQKSTNNLENLEESDGIKTVLIPLEAETRSNISIDSCWFSSPIHQINELNRLYIKVHNSSSESLRKLPIRLIINEKQVGLANIDIDPKSDCIIEIPFTVYEKGLCKAILEITDFPVTFDDKFYFTFDVSDEIGIIELTDNLKNNYLNTLFGKDSSFKFTKTEINRFDFSLLEINSMVILSSFNNISSGLSESLQHFVSDGGSLVVFYPITMKDNSVKEFLTNFSFPTQTFLDTIPTQFEKIALNDVFFSEVFERVPKNMEMPIVYQHWDLAISSKADMLIGFENGSPALLRMPFENGLVYLFPFSLDEDFTNFQKQPLFVPIMLRMALMSVQNNPLYQTIGVDKFVSFKNISLIGDVIPKIVGENEFSFIPGVQTQQRSTRFLLYDNIQESGFYDVVNGKDSLCFALNYNRRESIPDCYDVEMINDFIKEKSFKSIKALEFGNLPVSETLVNLHHGDLLWRWFILMALLCLLGEVLILRFWK